MNRKHDKIEGLPKKEYPLKDLFPRTVPADMSELKSKWILFIGGLIFVIIWGLAVYWTLLNYTKTYFN